MPPGMRALGAVRTAAVATGAAKRGPIDAALAAVPLVEQLLARDRLAGPTTRLPGGRAAAHDRCRRSGRR